MLPTRISNPKTKLKEWKKMNTDHKETEWRYSDIRLQSKEHRNRGGSLHNKEGDPSGESDNPESLYA